MFVIFRTDASLQIGTGHVMRCLTLANALRNRGATCRFLCREHPGNLLEFIREHNFETIALPFEETHSYQAAETGTQPLLHEAWLGTHWMVDVEQTKAGIGDSEVDWLIVDHYALDSRWESSMRSYCKRIMVIDDVADRGHDCDLLLDQNFFPDMAVRYIEKTPINCVQLLGPSYALLQPQYAELHPRIPPREGSIARIFVYFGGADTNNLTGLTVAAYLALGREDILMDVVANSTNPHLASLKAQVKNCKTITLHVGAPSLASLMAQADLAIGAGGVTSLERCCMGLPSLVITLAANQAPIASELDRLGLICWLGDAAEISESRLVSTLKNICATGLTPDWSNRCRFAIDGRGVQRVASVLMLSAKTKIKARLATVDDVEFLLRWANDFVAHAKAVISNPVDQFSHRQLIYRRLRDLNNYRIFIVATEDNVPIGQVGFELISDKWEIHYSIDRVALGRGLGMAVLCSGIQAFRNSISGSILFGCVKPSNKASREEFERFEFQSNNLRDGLRLSIAICSDVTSWLNPYVSKMVLVLLLDGHHVAWAYDASTLTKGDICFYLSFSKIVDVSILSRFKSNLVVHESNLPNGRGWSPMTWLILEGENQIPVTLLEAIERVDAGVIYLQEWINLKGDELSAEWRQLQAEATLRICQRFVLSYPDILSKARDQKGQPSFYPRRNPKDSELDPNKTIAEQFNLIRVVDNEKYPLFFNFLGRRFVLKVESLEKSALYE